MDPGSIDGAVGTDVTRLQAYARRPDAPGFTELQDAARIAQGRGAKGFLLIYRGMEGASIEKRTIPLTEEVKIGCQDGGVNTVVIADQKKTISRRHLCVSPEGNNFYVEDLGSTNGTFFETARVTGRTLLNRDGVLAFGDARAAFYKL